MPPSRRLAHIAGALFACACLVIVVLGDKPIGGVPLQSERRGKLSPQVDDLFKPWTSSGSPGAAVLVMHQGEVVHAKGYGLANLEHGIPIRPATVFDIASVSKQFGAMAIALLEADGRLSIDDDVRRHIPELPDFGARITIRHLVHHTSGIRDWPGTLAMGGWDFQDVISFEQILRMTFHQRQLNFTPGDVHAYSNTGYNLLAEVVKRVAGKSFRRFCEERIFQPLGMRQTHFNDDHAEVVVSRAESYRPGPNGSFQHLVSRLTALGSSSLFTTIDDLARWIANFESAAPIVGGRRVVDRLHERGVLNSGERIAYAFGQSVGEYRGLETVSHGGSWAGYRSVLQRIPRERFAVAILANTANMNTSALAREITDLYLRDRLAPAANPSTNTAAPGAGRAGATADVAGWKPSSAELNAYAGEYRSAELSTSYIFVVEGTELVARHFRTGDRRLRPIAVDRFQAPAFGEVRFVRSEGGAIVGFTANSDRIRLFRFDRIGR
jgi:CubicO group peptidase (beta-lactamase class C family)